MMGIYKIENKQNHKIYIGQSHNVERRLKEHQNPNRYKTSGIPVEYAIHVHGKENFTYEAIEECPEDKLNERESYWISFYQSDKTGYNCNCGGDCASRGENNGRAKLTLEDVVEIRQAYANRERRIDVYQRYKDKVTLSTFQGVWCGHNWSHVMPKVFTPESKHFYTYEACIGERSHDANFTNKEVAYLREQYATHTAKELYPPYKDRCSYQSFQILLCGSNGAYRDIPCPDKRAIRHSQNFILSDDEVKQAREYYVEHSDVKTYAHFEWASKVTLGHFKFMLHGKYYRHLPWYSKRKKQWINE